ncbi:lipopolysaccharide-induced tumor necrosis factor-alpha factor homolog [Anoplophora glabripennis]|uniref:lipopolysaccharide-induced tumor necrosis factor-alpha factor homolog n=1 Tax=Anoplophora glabripennis TaxID=217634 RepID=UPI0008740DA1|nr:lipopolysaccharide-induced tumor necrosis factor-alpha factor homolog [Anoplophora glabripennis]
MERYLICQICGEKLPFDPVCTCTLGEHLVKNHPDAEMTHFIVEDTSLCGCGRESTSSSSEGLYSTADAAVGNKSAVFKTTIETWKPGPLNVICPLCGKEDRPCIRKQRNKVAYTQFGALCMVTCWPICFLPFLMSQSSTIHLYCRHCGALIGEYNRQTGTLKPAPIDPSKKLNVPSNLC